jgi:hypothetical protein
MVSILFSVLAFTCVFLAPMFSGNPNEYMLPIVSVLISILLTHCQRVRSLGLAGIGGIFQMNLSSPEWLFPSFLFLGGSLAFLILSVGFAIHADCTEGKQQNI